MSEPAPYLHVTKIVAYQKFVDGLFGSEDWIRYSEAKQSALRAGLDWFEFRDSALGGSYQDFGRGHHFIKPTAKELIGRLLSYQPPKESNRPLLPKLRPICVPTGPYVSPNDKGGIGRLGLAGESFDVDEFPLHLPLAEDGPVLAEEVV